MKDFVEKIIELAGDWITKNPFWALVVCLVGLILFLMQTHKYVGDIGNWGIVVGIVGIALIFHNVTVGIAVLVLGCCLIISGAIAAPKVAASASNNG